MGAQHLPGLVGAATFSVCETYRYTLTRQWGAATDPRFLWVMLNPSTADADMDDPTIRRCIAFSQREGAGNLTVVNLFALRSTDPAWLAKVHDPIGPLNDAVIAADARNAQRIVVAWGADAMAVGRVGIVLPLLGPGVLCLGVTKSGAPKHPLYVKGDAPLVPWGDA